MTDAATCCPRCAHTVIEHLFTSPVPGVWDVLQCGRCLYCWRTGEPDRRTRRDAYPDSFKLTADDIDNAPEVPAVPPLAVPAVHRGPGSRSR
ncbi:non-oxidative hydroxyarylic acid decarboxylases subunit D [Streptomyces sp. DSM 41527]|uniref:Non-oxidative hydroxyarylic acid decarboxylases subunit D n=1 Tax=Streptomyces mooreae TaxID=3075523 RepID=A0ABU2T5C3_9ACTN|nr:non-oxidative hydroxyarylic acid decarboxylases subunit D [Streptomyces sp. DSM 41527]MDT0456416.1 non-oxidative hydroxyarylic acid decarboxylases subunit D [Streptomyces sp. DSM 41527]